MKNLNILQKNRSKKIDKCIFLLSKIDNETARYNIELLEEFKTIYILEGSATLPDRIIAELNYC
jgi:hypothetical protein